MNPHSVQKRGRTCVSCHRDSRASGLGRGTLLYKAGKWKFTPALSRHPDMQGINHPLDAFVNLDGVPLVHTSRPGLRTFTKKEIVKILYVGLCLDCHPDFNDKVMKSWNSSTPPEPCRFMPYQ